MTGLSLGEQTRRYLRSPRGEQRTRFLRCLGYNDEQIITNAVVAATVRYPEYTPATYEEIQAAVQELLVEEVEARR